jgi:hypothetical protein
MHQRINAALTALYFVSRIVFRVIFIELFLILSFAAMACHLYFDFDSFRDLPTSFLSLFEMQTTAATPSLWIPVYAKDRSSAIFFISFLIICVFFVHSIGTYDSSLIFSLMLPCSFYLTLLLNNN